MSPLRRQDAKVQWATTETIQAVWDERWRGFVVCLKTVYKPEDVEGLMLVDHHEEPLALATFHVDGPSGQIVTLDTIIRGRGYGGRLLEVVESAFRKRGLGRAWALMTNDNLRAVSLYFSRGYRLTHVHLDAVDRVREHKPQLPLTGYDNVPMRDLWELEKTDLGRVPLP